jgi:uncharacterized RDD family membrane protein YckC
MVIFLNAIIEITNGSILRRISSFIVDYIILLPLVLILYQLWKDVLWNGQSIGNKIFKIQIIQFKTGKKPSIFRIVLKNAVFILTIGLGSLFVLFNDSRRSLGDIICSTIMISRIDVKNT